MQAQHQGLGGHYHLDSCANPKRRPAEPSAVESSPIEACGSPGGLGGPPLGLVLYDICGSLVDDNLAASPATLSIVTILSLYGHRCPPPIPSAGEMGLDFPHAGVFVW